MRKLALLFSATVTTSLALFAGCSSTTGTPADGGTATDATTTDASTTTDATPTDAATPSVCDSLKACANDKPAEVAEAKATCVKEEAGKCAAEFKAYIKCASAKTFCNDAGERDIGANDCPTELAAYIKCSTPAVDSGTDATGDTATPPAVVNGCTTYVDATNDANLRSITWDLAIGGKPGRCLMIKAGQDVTWMGNFTAHPLASFNGDTPSPIVDAQPGDTTVTSQAPANAATKPASAAGSRAAHRISTRRLYCQVANAVPQTDAPLLVPKRVAGWVTGKVANSAGTRTRPPPPTIESTKPARSEASETISNSMTSLSHPTLAHRTIVFIAIHAMNTGATGLFVIKKDTGVGGAF